MDCPTRKQLDDWLAGHGDPGLASHVEGCADCQAVLDGLTGEGASGIGFTRLRPQVALPVMEWSRAAARRAGEAIAARPDGNLAPGDLVGHFKIVSEIGRGGSGTVYRAVDTVLGRAAALKVFRSGNRERILREARSAAAVVHHAVVPILSVIDQGPDLPPAIAMELVEGENLAARIARDGPLPAVEAAELMRRVASGTAAAHATGTVHRDIKPGNILLDPRSDRVMLADFGLATGAGEGDGAPWGGTAGFIAPERIGGDLPASQASDVYSLGATLYQALTGEPPHKGPLGRVLLEDPAPARALNRSIPRNLETICHKAMARNPASRYASAGEFAEDLGRWLSDRPIVARPAGPVERSLRWLRRNRRVASVALVVGLLLVALAVVSMAFAVKSARDAAALRAGETRARENLETALDEIARMIAIAGGEASRWPGTSPMRKKLIELAGQSLDRLALANLGEPGTAPAAARVALALSEFLQQTGDTSRALEILGTLAMKNDSDPELAPLVRVARLRIAAHHTTVGAYDRAIAACREVALAEGATRLGAQALTQAGTALRLGKNYKEAREELTAARLILDSLPPQATRGTPYHTIHGELAATAVSAGFLEEALSQAREALRHARDCRPETPAQPFTPTEETRAHLTLANILLKLGRIDESAAEAKAAEDAIGPAARTDPQRLDWRQMLVEALMARGDCLWNTGDFQKALAIYEPARAGALELVKADPESIPYRMQAIFIGARSAEMRARRMEFSQCASDVREIIGLFDALKGRIPDAIFKRDHEALALDLAVVERFSKVPMEDPTLPDVANPDIARKIRTGRVLSLARMGRWDSCRKHLAEETAVKERKPAEYLQLARACTLLASQDPEMVPQALEFLKKAVAGNPDLRISSISDPEFIPLRKLPDFQAIVQAKP